MRLGILGGTFDPPHAGHLIVASDAFEALELDRVVFIPNARQPLKADNPGAAAPDRLEMVRLLCQGDPRFEVDSIEVDRGGLSFTVETVRVYRNRYPDAALFLLIGQDVVGSLPSWRDSESLLGMVELVVLTRDSATTSGPGRRVETRRIDVSSTEVRERISKGLRITGFVPDRVAEYIESHGLYKTA